MVGNHYANHQVPNKEMNENYGKQENDHQILEQPQSWFQVSGIMFRIWPSSVFSKYVC